jgi:hypothetical protein
MAPRRRIDSVLAQTCGDFEVILSDEFKASRGRCPQTVIGEIPRNVFPPPLLGGCFGMRTLRSDRAAALRAFEDFLRLSDYGDVNRWEVAEA